MGQIGEFLCHSRESGNPLCTYKNYTMCIFYRIRETALYTTQLLKSELFDFKSFGYTVFIRKLKEKEYIYRDYE